MEKKLKYLQLFEGQWQMDKSAISEMKSKIEALKNETDSETLYKKALAIQDEYYNIVGNDSVYQQLFNAVEEQRNHPKHSIWKNEIDRTIKILTQLEQ